MKRALCLTLLLLASPLWAANAERGKTLHDDQCRSCHGSDAYTRGNRFVATLAALQQQVQRCEVPASAKWNDEDLDDVVAYLNQAFYKFPQ